MYATHQGSTLAGDKERESLGGGDGDGDGERYALRHKYIVYNKQPPIFSCRSDERWTPTQRDEISSRCAS